MRDFFRKLRRKIERTVIAISVTARIVSRVLEYYGAWKLLAKTAAVLA